MSWNLPSGWTIRISPGFGLNDSSHGLLLRWGLSREIPGFRDLFLKVIGGRSLKIVGLLLLLAWISTFAQFQTGAVFAGVPAKERTRTNPLANDANAVAAGRKLFDDHSVVSHGAVGGGGSRAPSLINAAMQSATPGEIYWVITNGVIRRGMPAWSKLPAPQRWQIVTYLTSLNTPGNAH
jgi:mono/diheme cytochrome c family protein